MHNFLVYEAWLSLSKGTQSNDIRVKARVLYLFIGTQSFEPKVYIYVGLTVSNRVDYDVGLLTTFLWIKVLIFTVFIVLRSPYFLIKL